MAQRAWAELQAGHADRAFEQTQPMMQMDRAIAAVHVAAALRHVDPLQVAAICNTLIHRSLRTWPDERELLRTCGWHLVSTRTHAAVAQQAAAHLIATDAYDDDARGLQRAANTMRELPERKWAPPREAGAIKARRKRDFVYLYKYLRPEDGSITASGNMMWMPEEGHADNQLQVGVHADLYLRGHELVPAGWRGSQSYSGTPNTKVDSHQLHGGYRLSMFRKTTLLLDGTAIFQEGRDEGAVRFRVEREGVGVWSADPAIVWTPWGRHGALRLGWEAAFERLATLNLDVEGQIGSGKRLHAHMRLSKALGSIWVRLDGQLGRAARPLNDRYIVRNLPGIEGRGASLSLEGRFSKRMQAEAMVGMRTLHADVDDPGTTGVLTGLSISGGW